MLCTSGFVDDIILIPYSALNTQRTVGAQYDVILSGKKERNNRNCCNDFDESLSYEKIIKSSSSTAHRGPSLLSAIAVFDCAVRYQWSVLVRVRSNNPNSSLLHADRPTQAVRTWSQDFPARSTDSE